MVPHFGQSCTPSTNPRELTMRDATGQMGPSTTAETAKAFGPSLQPAGCPVRRNRGAANGSCVLAQRDPAIYRALLWKWSFDRNPR